MYTERIFDLSPGKIAGLYLFFGVSWISTTDSLVLAVFESSGTISAVQTAKGWIFVGLSFLLIYGLSYFHHRQFRESQQRLQTATNQLQVLLRIYRHNIRNNLNVVIGRLNLSKRKRSETRDTSDLDIALEKVEETVEIGSKMQVVNELNLEGTNEMIDLTDVVSGAINSVENQYSGVEISTNLPNTALIYGDQTVARAVEELLENSIEHNPEPPNACKVSIDITKQNGHVEVEIADNGPAIPEARSRRSSLDRNPIYHI